MNEIIQNNLFLLIIILLLIILLLIGILVYIIFKLLSKNNFSQSNQNLSEPSVKNKSNIPPLNHRQELSKDVIAEKFFCHNHHDKTSNGSCLICEEVFCEECLIEHEGLFFCKEHFRVFANNKWVAITDEKTTPNNPEDGLYIWNFKRKIWKNRQIPTFVLTHYKINVENDYIESYVQLNVFEDNADKMIKELKEFKESGA